jgi:DNA primase
MYSKESLETLRQKIDLGEVISSYVPMKRSGASYKGLCPFHEEKTPSFMLNKGDSHYHCFGCGAHGDAISFLMEYVKMSFVEALEFLAERFQVSLDKVDSEEKGPNKKRLKQALEKACAFYRFFLLHSDEGKAALEYLYERDIDLQFIQKFEIGYAPKHGSMVHKLLRAEGFSEEELQLSGILRIGATGRRSDFFSERITFPIRDRMGAVIGFSSRKFKEETFGGKYINTAETPLFKKSHTLFGFCYSRHRIAKERKAIIVEGQVDALRLIFEGFDYTVAGQGTAFGEGHLKELLSLGVNQVYLAFDGDKAGQEASVKVGDLFQSKGVEVMLIPLPKGSDPDTFLRENGKEAFSELLEKSEDYLSFYYKHLASFQDMTSPSQKNEIVETIAARIRAWEHPILVHESLKKLAELAEIPQETLGAEAPLPRVRITRASPLSHSTIDPDRILEMDLLRWLFISPDPESFSFLAICKNIAKEDFKVPACACLFDTYLGLTFEQRREWFTLAGRLNKKEEQEVLNELLEKKVNKQRIEENVLETIKNLLNRNWMEKKEKILEKIKQSSASDDEMSPLIQEFNNLSKSPPQLIN